MKHLARYSIEAHAIDNPSAPSSSDVMSRIDSWLSGKGIVSEDGLKVVFRDGRQASVERRETKCSRGHLAEVVLTEPTQEGGKFRTSITVAESESTLAVSVELGVATTLIAPTHVEVYCPAIIRELLALDIVWRYQQDRVTSRPLKYLGAAGGEEFISLAWNSERAIPLVVISQDDGQVLDEVGVAKLANDLAGLATVIQIDSEASWYVTNLKGKQWSCYGGAIRLYWPNLAASTSPFQHSLWTSERLLNANPNPRIASANIRDQLRRKIVSQSAFAVPEPHLFGLVRLSSRNEELEGLRGRISALSVNKQLADELFEAAAKLESENQRLTEENEKLRDQVRSFQEAYQWKRGSADEVIPDADVPPATVEDAVLTAMEKFESDLIFGADVNRGVKGLFPEAGPPTKVLAYFEALSEFTRLRRTGSLGMLPVQWFNAKGVTASGESETIENSADSRRARTWECGGGEKTFFSLHLKPTDGTAPDKCVRIYFLYDERTAKTVVGWVGRHP